jgi:hypothetical protein
MHVDDGESTERRRRRDACCDRRRLDVTTTIETTSGRRTTATMTCARDHWCTRLLVELALADRVSCTCTGGRANNMSINVDIQYMYTSFWRLYTSSNIYMGRE